MGGGEVGGGDIADDLLVGTRPEVLVQEGGGRLTTAGPDGDGEGAGAATAPTPGDGTFPGDYRIRGTNPDGSRYRGTLAIEGDEAGSLALDWDTNGSYDGVGVAEGGLLAATHGDDGTACNVGVYPIAVDGTLDGRWVSYDGRGPNQEAVAVVIPGGRGITGSYAIEGINADGSDYSGSMDIVDAGEAFEITRQAIAALAPTALAGLTTAQAVAPSQS